MTARNKIAILAILLAGALAAPASAGERNAQSPPKDFPDISFLQKIMKDIEDNVVGIHLVNGWKDAVILTSRRLIYYRSDAPKELAEYGFGVNERPLRLDLLDASLGCPPDAAVCAAVTSFMGMRPSSYIFKITKERKFDIVSKDVPYFLRLLRTSGGHVLAAQKSSDVSKFDGGVFQLLPCGSGGVGIEACRKVEKKMFDLPDTVSIYEFAFAADGSAVWVRKEDGTLRRFEKAGKKWKSVFKSAEKYRAGVNCTSFLRTDVISERVTASVCAPAPVISVHGTGAGVGEMLILPSHSFVVASVLLEPPLPQKASVHMLAYDGEEGLSECGRSGPYQGWIGDIAPVPTGTDAPSPFFLAVRNGSEKERSGPRLIRLDARDCRLDPR